MKGNVYGYVRVSTKEQNEGGQEAFRGAGYLSEMGSGQIKSPPAVQGKRKICRRFDATLPFRRRSSRKAC